MPSGRLKVIINFEVIKIYRAPITAPREERDIPPYTFRKIYFTAGGADFSTTSIKVTAINFALNKLASSSC